MTQVEPWPFDGPVIGEQLKSHPIGDEDEIAPWIVAEPVKQIRSDRANKLTFKEKRELEQLDKEIEALTAEKGEISQLLEGGTADYEALQRASSRFVEIGKLLDEKEMRWLELSEKE